MQATYLKLDIEFDGSPHSLAQIATTLDKVHLKIISSFSHRALRGKDTRWGIIADPARSPYGLRELQSTLLQLPEIHTVTVAPLIPERTFCKAPPYYEHLPKESPQIMS